MQTAELEFELPPERIAVTPASPRDSAKLLVLRRDGSGGLEHRTVADLPEILGSDAQVGRRTRLVVNRSRVVPARLIGMNSDTGGKVEGLFLREVPAEEASRFDAADDGLGGRTRVPVWSVMLKARRTRPGFRIALMDPDDRPTGVSLVLVDRDPEEPAAWRVRVEHEGVNGPEGPGAAARATPAVLERVGRTPIPPYIRQARVGRGVAVNDAADRSAYQTVYAKGLASGGDQGDAGSASGCPDGAASIGNERGAEREAERGASVAAPTAGLHFTPALIDRLRAGGLEWSGVELHVGAGTFRPIEAESLSEHRMHAEWCSLGDSGSWLGQRLEGAGLEAVGQAGGDRVIAVGTTTARTLESFAAAPQPWPTWLSTEAFIAPGHRWRAIDGLLTNFHLPRSSLLAMVGALLPGGVPELLEAYHVAIEKGYRFYSYGDAMLIL